MKIRGEIKTGRVWLDEKELDPKVSQAVVNHSPDGFSWGYAGSGPSQLALAILLEVTGDKETASSLYQQFKFEVVSKWPQEDIEREVDINSWLGDRGVTKASDKPLFAVLFKESMGSFHSMYWKLIHADNENEVRAWAEKYAETLYDEFDGLDEERQEWTYQDGDYALSIESVECTTKEAWMEQVFKESLVK